MNNKGIDWLDKHSDALKVLCSITREIEILAEAFITTGNENIRNTLLLIANDIEKSTKDIRNAMTESITESINRSAESSKNLLAASLAGIMIAKRDI